MKDELTTEVYPTNIEENLANPDYFKRHKEPTTEELLQWVKNNVPICLGINDEPQILIQLAVRLERAREAMKKTIDIIPVNECPEAVEVLRQELSR